MKLVANLHILAKIFVCILIICMPGYGLSQTNPSLIDFKVKKGNTFTFQIESITIPEFQLISEFPDWGNVRRNEDLNGDNVYEIDYTAPVDFNGTIEFLFTYTGRNAFPYYTYTRQVKIMAHVVSSIIETEIDIVKSNGLQELTIQPLINDLSSEGALKLVDVAYSSFGNTFIQGEDILKFTPGPGFEGKSYIEYIVQDKMGTKAEGSIYIIDTNESFSSSERSLLVSSEYGAYIFMPKLGMQLISQSGNKGTVESKGELAYFYDPISGRIGNDVLVFEDDNGNELKVFINVIDNAPDLDPVQDDEFYTAVDQTITFDVSENDMVEGTEISYFSSDLIKVGDGQFRYTPPAGFRGFKKFIYKVNTGSEILTGNITIKIDDYFPQDLKYQFRTPKNKDLVIEYDVPLEGYAFSSANSPKYGTLEFFSEDENISSECGPLSNIVKIIYSPRTNFIGYDEFEVEYCTAAGNCNIVKTKINVFEDQDETCPCVRDCVYPGDANHDGLVNLSDLLVVGYYLGNNGKERIENGISWKGYDAENWGIRQEDGTDIKYADSDGNGVVTGNDTLAIIANYGKYSTYTPSSISIQQKSPIKLVPQSSEYSVGEEFLIDVILGDDKYPALDVHGLVFSISLDPEVFDLSTLEFSVDRNSWLAEGFGTIEMSQTGDGGRIEIGISRTSGLPKSGKGKVGTISVVGVEEIEGFRNDEKDPLLPIDDQTEPFKPIVTDIIIESVSAIDSRGKWFTMPVENTSIKINKDSGNRFNSIISQSNESIIYPNPSNDVIHVFAGKEKLLNRIRMIDISGRTIYNQVNLSTDFYKIKVDNFTEGIYILEIWSGETFEAKKVKISK